MSEPIRCPLCGEENAGNQWLVDAGPTAPAHFRKCLSQKIDNAVSENPALFFLDRAIGAAIRYWHKLYPTKKG